VKHNGMQYDPIQGQGYEALKVGNPPIFKSYLIFCLVFVSRFFELGRNVSCEESTVSPYGWLLLTSYKMRSVLNQGRSSQLLSTSLAFWC